MNNSYEQKKKMLQRVYIENLHKGKVVKFKKNNSNLFRKQKDDKTISVSINDFDHVIKIDKKNRTAIVEAMIPFEKLVDETLKYGLLPPVVPQLKTITLGGAISGVGIEASSFRYGLVHETILEMEVMLPDGKIVIATPDNEYKDLFFAIPNSYGTFGYVLQVKMKLIPALPYVKLYYIKYTDSQSYFKDLKTYCDNKKYDYIDGVVFSKNLMYIVGSNFVKTSHRVSDYKYMNIFYKSITKNKFDFLTTRDFIWRWDTDWFWCSKIFFMQNPVARLLLGKFMLGSKSYWKIARFDEKHKIQEKFAKLTGTYHRTESVVQDVAIPIENCAKFLDFFTKKIGILPVWICPTRSYKKNVRFTLFSLDPEKLYVDFGFWDTVMTDKPEGYHNKLVEHEVEKLGGKKSLYSDSFYKEDEFWKIYDGSAYKKLKIKYDPKNIKKDLYTKCVLNK